MRVDKELSPDERLVLSFLADQRPAWLWSGDGRNLLWRNAAARGFFARSKKSGLKRAGPAVPIGGQVARLMRLAIAGQTSRGRVQFMCGKSPAAATCRFRRIARADGEAALLIVAQEAIEDEVRRELGPEPEIAGTLLPEGSLYLKRKPNGAWSGHKKLRRALGPALLDALAALDADDTRWTAVEAGAATALPMTGRQGSLLVLVPDEPQDAGAHLPDRAEVMAAFGGEAVTSPDDDDDEDDAPDVVDVADAAALTPDLPVLPEAVAPETDTQDEAADAGDEPDAEETPETGTTEPAAETPARLSGLSELVARLAGQTRIFDPLTPADDARFAGERPEQVVPPEWHEEIDADGDKPDTGFGIDADEPDDGSVDASEELVFGSFLPSGDAHDAGPAHAAADDAGDSLAMPTEAAVEADTATPQQPQLWRIRARTILATPQAEDEADESLVESLGQDGGAADALTPDVAATSAHDLPENGATTEPESMEAVAGEPSPATGSEVESINAAEGANAAGVIDMADSAPDTADVPAATGTDLDGSANAPEAEDGAADATEAPGARTGGGLEPVSRYNFDELSRILNDRVNGDGRAGQQAPRRSAELINLGDETLVLNRLPLGLLIFRDGQTLFANKALSDITGHDSVAALKALPLSELLPTFGPETGPGPVTRLRRAQGGDAMVDARLQAINWQGQPALMLSARPAVPTADLETMIRQLAADLAEMRSEGYLETDRAALIEAVTPQAAAALKRNPGDLIGLPLHHLLTPETAKTLRTFLDLPGKAADRDRPRFVGQTRNGEAELIVMPHGRAGLVNGYFAFVRALDAPQAAPVSPAPALQAAHVIEAKTPPPDLALLSRVSRDVRRPLNTIVGFSELIASEAFGPLSNGRYLEYARDIKTAGVEIATLIEEIDDLSNLNAGQVQISPEALDIGALLDHCVARVRHRAAQARVLVRSAIPDRLPRVRADRGSLAQALLNLIASAIDQSPVGGQVVLSAHADEKGGIAIAVRDAASVAAEPTESFTIFRDGLGKDGEVLHPVRSSVGLALTRSLIAVNSCMLTIAPVGATGTMMEVRIPAELAETA